MVNFRIDVVVDPTGAATGAQKVERSLDRVDQRAVALRQTLLRTFALIGGVAVIGSAVRNLAQFEDTMATVRAVSGATADEFGRLRERAQELGITTRFTANQAAEAEVTLARAGFSVTESLEAVGGVLLLAQAGNIGLADSANIAASALRGFRLEATETGRVVDVLTLGANSANTTVSQLGEGLKFVAPVAAGLRVSLEQTVAALGTLSDAGLQATLAGTGLRRVLAELESPSSNSQKILASLGVTADEVRVSQVGLVQALERLREAGIDTGTALELFGQRGGPAFEVLVNNIPRVRELTKGLENAGGVARATADIMDNTLGGALKRTRSALEGLNLALGDAGNTNILRNVFEGLAAALRTMSANIEITSTLFALLATIVAARVVPAMFGFKAALATISPVTAAFIAAAGFAAVVLGDLEQKIKDINTAFKNLEEDSKFAQIGQQIRVVETELRNLSRIQERQGSLSESQQARVEELTKRLEGLRKEARRVSDAGQQLAQAQAAQNVTVENSLAGLDRRIVLLRQARRESEITSQVEQEVQTLLQAGQIPSASEREQIEQKLRLIQALTLQQAVLEEIKGPQEENERRQAALNGLLEQGRITAQEYNAAIQALRTEVEKVAGRDAFADQIDALREGIEIAQTRLILGDEEAQLLEIELDLRRQGVELTAAQTQELQALLARQTEVNDQLRQQAEAQRELERASQREERLVRELDLTTRLAEREAELLAIREKFPELANEIDTELEDLRLRGLEASTALGDGFARAFIKIRREAEDLASVGESIVNAFADNATDALVEFAETGRFAFEDFARGVLSDLTRIIARLLVVQALSAILPGGGAAADAVGNVAAGGFGGGRAGGGDVQANRSFIVGEQGPEMFVPDRPGTIVPNGGNQKNEPAAPPSVTVVNVSDPNEIAAAIASGEADDVILNVLARNPQKVKQVVS